MLYLQIHFSIFLQVLLKVNTIKEKLYRTLVKNGEKDFIQDYDIIIFGEKIDISKGQRKEFTIAIFLSKRKERSGAIIRKKHGKSSSKL